MKERLKTVLILPALAALLFLAGLAPTGGVLPPHTALAADIGITEDVCNNSNATSQPSFCGEVNKSKSETYNILVGSDGIITKVVQAIAYLSGIIAVIVIIMAAIRFITTGSNPESAAGARRMVIYALIGLVIAVSAQVIVTFVLSRL